MIKFNFDFHTIFQIHSQIEWILEKCFFSLKTLRDQILKVFRCNISNFSQSVWPMMATYWKLLKIHKCFLNPKAASLNSTILNWGKRVFLTSNAINIEFLHNLWRPRFTHSVILHWNCKIFTQFDQINLNYWYSCINAVCLWVKIGAIYALLLCKKIVKIQSCKHIDKSHVCVYNDCWGVCIKFR